MRNDAHDLVRDNVKEGLEYLGCGARVAGIDEQPPEEEEDEPPPVYEESDEEQEEEDD